MLVQIQKFIDQFHTRLSQIISWFTLIMVLLTLLIVILRYGFNMGWIAMQESVMYLHAAVFMLGAAYTLQVDQHVRVDVFYRKFSERGKALTNLLGSLLLLMPVNIFILLISWEYVGNSWGLLEGSQEAGGLPLVFILKTFILLFAGSLSLQGIAEIIKSTLVLAAAGERK
ncbi:TRAP transporter small permease subunit [Neptunicella sp. SCSIO 80796]|uniref:TRAP transporter small permease subunit n=1 Tax=Neptunicella plasticusilytica TaxID=3117012 RepID=UPI003A4D53DB